MANKQIRYITTYTGYNDHTGNVDTTINVERTDGSVRTFELASFANCARIQNIYNTHNLNTKINVYPGATFVMWCRFWVDYYALTGKNYDQQTAKTSPTPQ
jgi:hypothetical protein